MYWYYYYSICTC